MNVGKAKRAALVEARATAKRLYDGGRWDGPDTYVTVGHTFTKNGTRVDVVRPWQWVKAQHRHATWVKNKIAENNALLKGGAE